MTPEQIELINTTCPHCRLGSKARKRTDTGEWVHDQVLTKVMGIEKLVTGHSICWADGLRRKWESPQG